MNDLVKKRANRSPNYPQQTLEWAIKSGLTLLAKEQLHSMPVDIAAQGLGYKDANNGKARSVLANLKSFGILKKAAGGKLAVSQDVQRYKLAPSEADRLTYLKQWVRKPLLYSKLLDKYTDGLPSDAVLIFELVDEHSFNEDAAQKAIDVFRESLRFVETTANKFNGIGSLDEETIQENDVEQEDDPIEQNDSKVNEKLVNSQNNSVKSPPPSMPLSGNVRYPIRLAGGRMAYIDVPDPFFEKDKEKLKAQLEIIGTVDEDDDYEAYDM